MATVLGSRLTSVVATAAGTLAVVAVLGLAGQIPTVGHWLPNHLLGALTDLAAGGDPRDYGAALAVTVATSAGLLALAARWGAAREV